MYAGAVIPHLPPRQAEKEMDRLKLNRADRAWVRALRGKDLHNGAIVAIDYRTGDVLAYVGSAGYDRKDLKSRQFQPEFDVARRVSGSPARPSSRSSTPRRSRSGSSRPAACCWTSRPTSGAGRRRTQIASIAAR